MASDWRLRYWRARLRIAGWVNRLGFRDLAIRIHPAFTRAYSEARHGK